LTEEEFHEIEEELDALREVLLNDITVQNPDSAEEYPLSGLKQVIDEQLSEILMEEFGADLPNFRRTQQEFGLKLSLLVEKVAGAAEDEPTLTLLGFLAYKAWGPPSPGVSIGAVGTSSKYRGKGYGRQLMQVAENCAALLGGHGPDGFVPGEVRLRSLATAVRFYERLGYERVDSMEGNAAEKTPGCPDLEATRQEAPVDEDDAPCVPMVKRMTPVSPRTAASLAPCFSPRPDPWCPKQSRALEDGPTWPPISEFTVTGLDD
jgi:GNAT superfamily N-acetyltransferase